MPKNSKRFNELLKKVDVNKIYSVDEAVSTVKTLASAKFDETVEIALKLNTVSYTHLTLPTKLEV